MHSLKTIALLSAAIVAVGATTAYAQDAAPDAPPEAAAEFSWTGPYVGVNGGYALNGQTQFDRTTGDLPNNTNALATNLRPGAHLIGNDGFTLGGQIGYNYDGGRVVIGLEADAAYTDIKQTDTLATTEFVGPLGVPSTTPVTRLSQYRGSLDYLGTVRGRIGLKMNQFLLYGTGGLAYGRVRQEITFYGPNSPSTPFFAGQENGIRVGYAVGGGVEVAVPTNSFVNVLHSSALTFRVEYLRYDLGRYNLRFPGVNGGSEIGGYSAQARTYGDIVRGGINYRF
jgi:outer membrane immunogenic protein